MTTPVLLAVAGSLAAAGLGACLTAALGHRAARADQPPPDPDDPVREAAEHSGLIPRPAGPSPTTHQEDLTW
ncbi:hypothetical protein ACFWOG_04460 [Kitasatospora sp. NPDC058406]|uniref:hypothetical protein n=1 Tax=Kitasatospora sp. NPDC058406 TaxID=3346483 RepID=UPI00365A12AB